MAEVLETYVFRGPGGGVNAPIYDQWLDGRIHRITAKKDVRAGTALSIAQSLRRRAQLLGITIRTNTESQTVLVVQAVSKNGHAI